MFSAFVIALIVFPLVITGLLWFTVWAEHTVAAKDASARPVETGHLT
jgi:uncharacterized iron-regulated membrane protein